MLAVAVLLAWRAQAMTYAQENKLMFVKNAAVVDLVTAYVAK